MINSDHLVNDGLDSACGNNHRTTWTYNHGVILGELATLANVSGDKKPLEAAQSIALAAIWAMSRQSVCLRLGRIERGQITCELDRTNHMLAIRIGHFYLTESGRIGILILAETELELGLSNWGPLTGTRRVI